MRRRTECRAVGQKVNRRSALSASAQIVHQREGVARIEIGFVGNGNPCAARHGAVEQRNAREGDVAICLRQFRNHPQGRILITLPQQCIDARGMVGRREPARKHALDIGFLRQIHLAAAPRFERHIGGFGPLRRGQGQRIGSAAFIGERRERIEILQQRILRRCRRFQRNLGPFADQGHAREIGIAHREIGILRKVQPARVAKVFPAINRLVDALLTELRRHQFVLPFGRGWRGQRTYAGGGQSGDGDGAVEEGVAGEIKRHAGHYGARLLITR